MKRSAAGTSPSRQNTSSPSKKLQQGLPESIAPKPPPTFEYSKLKLVRRIPTRNEDEEEDEEFEEDEDPELDYECQWLRRIAHDIVGEKGKIYGQIRWWLIDVEEIRSHFYAAMDEPSAECMRLAFALFDSNGYLKSQFHREGNLAWGQEVNGPHLAYLDEIEITKEERGKGIGTWALQKIWSHKDGLDVEGFEDIEFLFTLPATLPTAEDEVFWQNRPSPAQAAAREAAHLPKQARVESFFRKVNFRRVGNTMWFCCARDLGHPSRKIAVDKDAKFKEPKTAEEIAKAKKEDAQTFAQMKRQAGW